jgi:hyperosmotically inducible periplasmic protein
MNKVIRFCSAGFCALFLMMSTATYADNNNTSDTLITTKIKSKLVANNVTNPFTIGVETTNGLVALSGTVRSLNEAATAVQLAEETDGVKNVDTTNLVLDEPSQQPVTDAYITAKVKGMLVREKLVNGNMSVYPIKVETKDGVVNLSGKADNKQQAQRAVSLAKQVDGVMQVNSTVRY